MGTDLHEEGWPSGDTQAGLLPHHRPRGRQVLKERPPELNTAYLERFPEFHEFRRRGLRQLGDGSRCRSRAGYHPGGGPRTEGQRAKKGIFITTSSFTNEAREYTRMIDSKIILMDGDELAGHMIDFGVGVASVASYELKKVDQDYFSEEA